MLLALLLALSVFAAACGGDDDEGSADTGASSTDDAGSDSGEIASDFGVDVENKVIRVGINGDLSGPFASLVAEIVESQEVYWEVFNEKGGYQGWTVETVVLDSGYATDIGIQNYEELAQESDDGVLMITENTGSPITAAIAEQAAEDNMLVIPLSLASL